MTNSNNKKSVKRNNFKDVQICYILEGIEGVSNLTPLPGKPTLIQAINGLNDKGMDVNDLIDFTATNYPGGGGRGRASITIGESRTYKVQAVKDGSVFLRLPLSTLNVEKGDTVSVSFDDGKVVVTNS